MEFEPGDEIFFYVTGVQAFGGARPRHLGDVRGPHARLAAGQEEAESADATYPWRVARRAGRWCSPRRSSSRPRSWSASSSTLASGRAEHWHLAFQGQLRTIGEADATLLRERLGRRAAATPPREHVSDEPRAPPRAPLHPRGGERAAAAAEPAAAPAPRGQGRAHRRRRPTRRSRTPRRPTAAASAGHQVGVGLPRGAAPARDASRSPGSSCATSTAAWSTSPPLMRRAGGLPLLGARRGRGRLLARPGRRLRWPRAARLSALRRLRSSWCATCGGSAANERLAVIGVGGDRRQPAAALVRVPVAGRPGADRARSLQLGGGGAAPDRRGDALPGAAGRRRLRAAAAAARMGAVRRRRASGRPDRRLPDARTGRELRPRAGRRSSATTTCATGSSSPWRARR